MVKASAKVQKQVLPLGQHWLHVIDKGELEKAYQATSSFLQKTVSQGEFVKGVSTVLKPLGTIKGREVKDIFYSTQMKALPDGEYVVIQYHSSFENKKQAVETLSLMKEKDEWKVSGYFIR